VDLNGKISFYNEQFKKMWGLPDEIIAQGGHPEAALQFVKDKMIDSEKFFSKILELNSQVESETFYVFDLLDGRNIERYSIPQWFDGKIVGQVLSFRDISERKQSQQALIASDDRKHIRRDSRYRSKRNSQIQEPKFGKLVRLGPKRFHRHKGMGVCSP
jgi:two-component system sensor histidine kinase/response regulator